MRIFNVPSSARFLHTVIESLIDGKLVEGFSARANPERLADVTLYLPTQRAGRMAREVFLDVLQTGAAVLPRIVPLGAVDEDELEFASGDALTASALDIPPSLDGLQRRLTLARLVTAWATRLTPQDSSAAPLVAGGPASMLVLADDLAHLIDDMEIRNVDWRSFETIVPDEHDRYWQLTLQFLKIATEQWPAYLREIGRIEPMERRGRLIAAEAARLKNLKGPVIAAGSTGSMPTTAAFLQAIAKHPQGAVVLPGLDLSLEEEAWQSIGGSRDMDGRYLTSPAWSHPQYALHHLLTDVLGIKRESVETLGQALDAGREVLASEAMRPAGSSAIWHRRLAQPAIESSIAAAMTNISVIEAANPEMEALAIAVAMREARHNNMPAALVTPDRALARRVMAALGRWNLDFDDSGGDPLMDTPAGIFARLVADAVAEEFAPAALLALLKHPLFCLGAAQGAHKTAIADLELAILRGTRPPPGIAGLSQAFKTFREELENRRRGKPSSIHSSEQRAKIDAGRINAVQELIDRLTAAFKSLEGKKAGKSFDLAELAALHRDTIVALSSDDQGRVHAFENTDGSALASAFDELLNSADGGAASSSAFLIQVGDYADVFETAFSGHIVRKPSSSSAQLQIYGLLEARLTENPRVILGGLVEGVWPPQPRIDAWLSRPMRQDLGLDLPERRIGLTAHDFAQLLGAREVILSHSAKVGGAPAVASRFLHRLEAVAGEDLWAAAKKKGSEYARLAGELDRPDKVKPVSQPAPTPALALRPLKLSVTEIEHWLRDPYTIYAKHILKLRPLDPVDMPLTAADRGSAIHEALGEFTSDHRKKLPNGVVAVLRKYGEKHFAPLMERPEARALWWPRFLRIASWFADWETKRREDIEDIDAEISGNLKIKLGKSREFILTARADRIEHRHDGTFAILDYKTGQTASGKQVRLGLAPQLSLEAAILRDGGFKGIAAGSSVGELMYVRLSGNNPPGEAESLKLALGKDDVISPDQAADEAREKLEQRVRLFESESRSYKSLSLPMWSYRYGDYDDLARIKEWSEVGGGET
ncbi:MAG: double-strand break repair protein AddB [Rhizobiales bacterium]|nr:double-strand break repair protein AddB [Hyphomicrobiales bacterium]